MDFLADHHFNNVGQEGLFLCLFLVGNSSFVLFLCTLSSFTLGILLDTFGKALNPVEMELNFHPIGIGS
jgi:hypothetical protein